MNPREPAHANDGQKQHPGRRFDPGLAGEEGLGPLIGEGGVTTRFAAIATFLFLVAGPSPVVAGPLPIDLDVPGALEGLARDNPAHYDKIQRIIRDIPSKKESEVSVWMRVGFSAKDVEYVPLYLVSLPPKRRLFFTLDHQRYKTDITVEPEPRMKPTPAR